MIDMRVVVGIQIDNHYARAGAFELVTVDIGRERFVDDGRAQFLERIAQMPAKLVGLVQQRNANG